MKLETAIYGEVNNGHALRAASGDVDFARSISGRFDLPSNPPPGVAWSPAISGFAAQGRYVLARTFLDADAPRGNMVVAHALFASLDDIQDFRALGRIMAKLAPSADQIPAPSRVELDDGDDPTEAPELQQFAALLTDRSKKPIVRLGADGVENLVSSLWRNLWPAMRRAFAFRLSFAPDDLVDNPLPALVYSPPSLAVRWRAHPILGQTAIASDTLASKILSGDADSAPIVQFASSIGHIDTTLASFTRLVQAEMLLSQGPSFDALAAGMRLVNLLSPNADKGKTAKAELVQSLAHAIASARADQIMLLRNLSLPGFASLQPIWHEIGHWMETRSLAGDGQYGELLPIVVARNDAKEAILDWRVAIKKGGLALAARQPRKFAAAFWGWLAQSPPVLAAILEITPVDSNTEASLLALIPKQIAFETADLLSALVSRGWLALHGATLAASIGAANAVRAQLKVDKNASYSDGLKAALARAKPAERLSIAAANDDGRLDAIAGAEIVADSKLARTLDYTLVATQRIWTSALALDPASWRAPNNPQAARRTILDAFLADVQIFEPIIAAFARTPLADLSDYAGRGELWVRLDNPAPFLDATAEGWLVRAATGSADALDPRLELVVLQSRHLDQCLARSWPESLNVVASLERLAEDRALRWFYDQTVMTFGSTYQQAELLGHIILARNWVTLLNKVRDCAYSHRELQTTLRVCASMFSAWSRWLMSLSSISIDDKWNSFAGIAAELYPSGPDQRDLWERAGGRNSDLLSRTTGAENWRHALRIVRRGDGPVASKVLAEMQKDFKGNPDLRFIAADWDIVGDHRGRWY
jgi:hypothetical protein